MQFYIFTLYCLFRKSSFLWKSSHYSVLDKVAKTSNNSLKTCVFFTQGKCENAIHHGWPSGLHFVEKYLYILASYPYKTL